MQKNLQIATLLACLMIASAYPAIAGTPAKCVDYEVGYSPEGSAEELVLKAIDSATRDVKVLAYSFTAKEVVQALVRARRRNATVSLVVDASNLSSRHSLSALSILATTGASIRTIDRYKIHHDKVLIVDGKHVEFGSYNYSSSAATANSENANVCWNSPTVAAVYTKHWQSRWEQGTAFQPRY